MIKNLIVAASLALAVVGLGACSGAPSSGLQASAQHAQGTVDCKKTEQKGCLEFDILNLRAPENFNVQKDGKPWGPTYYKKLIDGKLQPAAPRTVVVYVWDVDSTPTSMMAEYRTAQDYVQKVNENRNKKLTTQLTPLSVTEIPPTSGPTFGTEYNIGQPKRAFRVTIPHGVSALQMPRGMFGKNSYVLICPEQSDGTTVYPDRITRKDGYWLTPKDIHAPGDYIVVPLLFKS